MLGQTYLVTERAGAKQISLIRLLLLWLLNLRVKLRVSRWMHAQTSSDQHLVLRGVKRSTRSNVRLLMLRRLFSKSVLISWLEHLLDEFLPLSRLLYNLDVQRRDASALIGRSLVMMLSIGHRVSLRVLV